MIPCDLPKIRAWLTEAADSPTHYQAAGSLAVAIRHLDALVAEVAELRAARGIEAPAPWRPSTSGALWERPCGPVVDGECADGWIVLMDYGDSTRPPWHWAWWLDGGKVKAEGWADTVLGAITAADAALEGK